MPTLKQYYEEVQNKRIATSILINGVPIAGHYNISWENSGFGNVPTANFELQKPLPANLAEGQTVSIYAGFEDKLQIQFVGIIENIIHHTTGASIECSGTTRRLKLLYDRLVKTLASASASTAVTELLQDAGVTNFLVNLPAWTIGAIVTGNLEFQTYGDAVNQIAEVDGSPFYEMPDGQCRVEVRDPIPSGTAFRSYYSGKLSNLTDAQRQDLFEGTLALSIIQPEGITNSAQHPRLRSLSVGSRFGDVKNKITALGAVVTVTGTGGQQESERLEQTVFGPSPFIPTPPTYYNLTVDRPLVDDINKLTEVAIREYGLHNRLELVGTAVVDGDPEMFLGCTVFLADPDYSGISARFFVTGYHTFVSEGDFITELQITGGAGAGSTPSINPFACFNWSVTGKSLQVLPVGIGPGGVGVIITFDGGCSKDFDGEIASYSWSDTEGNTGTGQFFQAAYDPASVTSFDMTLTVTDDQGNTDSVTKTVSVEGDDSDVGGQPTTGVYIFVAAEEYMMGSSDGGQTWNDINKAAAGVTGDFIRCSSQYVINGPVIAIFITDAGEIVMTMDACVTSFKPLHLILGTAINLGAGTFEIAPMLTPAACTWLIKSFSDPDGSHLLWFFDTTDDEDLIVDATSWLDTYISGAGGIPNTARLLTASTPHPSWPEISRLSRGLLS